MVKNLYFQDENWLTFQVVYLKILVLWPPGPHCQEVPCHISKFGLVSQASITVSKKDKKHKKWPNLKLKHIINYFMGESSLKWQNSKCCWKFVPIAFNHIYNNSKSTHVLVLVGDYCNYVSWKMFY